MMQEKIPPYTTKTGVRIGALYEPPLRADYTHEERFAQNLLLGGTGYSNMDKTRFVLYCACIAAFVFLLTALGVK